MLKKFLFFFTRICELCNFKSIFLPFWHIDPDTISFSILNKKRNFLTKVLFLWTRNFYFEEVFKHPSQVYLRVMDDFTTFLFLPWFLLVYFFLTNQFHKQCLCLVCLYKIKEQNQIYSFIRKNKQIIFLIIKKKRKNELANQQAIQLTFQFAKEISSITEIKYESC